MQLTYIGTTKQQLAKKYIKTNTSTLLYTKGSSVYESGEPLNNTELYSINVVIMSY